MHAERSGRYSIRGLLGMETDLQVAPRAPRGQPAGVSEDSEKKQPEREARLSGLGEPFERPPFAAEYPRDPELDRLLAYFVRGNHRAVRDGAEPLASKTADPKVAAAARDLRARIEPAPIARVLLGATLALLVVLTWWATHRSKELRNTPAPTIPKTVQTIVK